MTEALRVTACVPVVSLLRVVWETVLMDMSTVARRTRSQPPAVRSDSWLRILLGWQGEELLTEGRVMHVRTLEGGGAAAGVQFKKLEKDLTGRQTLSKLTKLVGELQRAEIKRR